MLYGVDNTFMGRALSADILSPMTLPRCLTSPSSQLDPSHRLLPVDFGYVSLNFDKNSSPPGA